MTPTDVLVDAIANAVLARLKPELAQSCRIAPRLLTVEQAGTYLGRTPKAVRHLLDNDAFPAVRTDNRIMLDVRDLDRWIEQGKA